MYKSFLIVLIIFVAQGIQADELAEGYAKLPLMAYPTISPDGKSIAYEMVHEGKPSVIIHDIDRQNAKHKVGALPLNGAKLRNVQWVSNDRLMVSIRLTSKFRQFKYNFTRLFSIDRYGLNPVYFNAEPNKWGFPLFWPRVIDRLEDDPEHVLASIDPVHDEWGKAMVHKINVYTGKKTLVESNRKHLDYFIADSKGQLRVGVKGGTGTGHDINVYHRKNNDAAWKLLQKISFEDEERLRPRSIDRENSHILIMSAGHLEDDNYDQDDYDLFKYDLNEEKIIGEYKHVEYDAAKKALKKAFPGKRVSFEDYTDPVKLGKVVARIYGDNQPNQYFFYDTEKKRADFIASAYPHLESLPHHPMELSSYAARDGLEIPAYITLPKSFEKGKSKPIPFVIYPHGGPWARDYWGFNRYVQYFASLGYGVIQPQFRGSTGFGHEHLRAGDKQWGLKIQDDISDSVTWAIKQGWAKADRICIVGANFGGYAVGMGLAKTPELYRCGVSENGVLDMKMFAKDVLWRNEYNQELINSEWGIKKVSPYHLRKNIEDPLLLIVGEKDTVVDPKHAHKMYKGMKKAKKDVSIVSLPNGEHWRTDEASQKISLTAMGAFLRKHLDE